MQSYHGQDTYMTGDASCQALLRWPVQCLFVLCCVGDGTIGLRSVAAEGRFLTATGSQDREIFSTW